MVLPCAMRGGAQFVAGRVSALLRIREAHLEAIELEDFEQLPGNVYAIGFIRTYAQYLELNESDLIMRFKAASVESGMADMVFEEEEKPNKFPVR